MTTVDKRISREFAHLTVRRLVNSDLADVSAILSESPGAAAWSQDSLRQLACGGFHAWVAEQEATIVGFLIGRIAADEFEILDLAVAVSCRRQGIASRLLEWALKAARTAGCRRVYLEVRASNPPALGLYERYGFTECGRRHLYYENPAEDALLLFREIDAWA